MKIRIPKATLERMEPDELRLTGRTKSDLKGLERFDLDLFDLDDDETGILLKGLERIAALDGRYRAAPQARDLLKEIAMWQRVTREGGAGQLRPESLMQFSDQLTEYLRTSPGRRVYSRNPVDDAWLGHQVSYVEYRHPTRDREKYYQEARVVMCLRHYELGRETGGYVHFHANKVDSRTVAESLAEAGYMVETPEIQRSYLESDARFLEYFDRVGRMVNVAGQGIRLDSSGFDRQGQNMTTDGIPGVGVIDVVDNPDDERDRFKAERVSGKPNFWARKTPRALRTRAPAEDDLPGNMAVNRGDTGPEDPDAMPEVPVHHYVMVYHLGWHRRYKVHVDGVSPYEFDREMGDKLVLPTDTKNLVNTLVGQGRIEFADIIQGKGSGICVLLGGPPGVGKTLTAEVFAEATERPLLSVQAAQLGISPDDIEKNLARVLRLGSRWNAVVLLDEADVYIAERGRDLTRNAIVAAFLRILERHTATIFLTTNHARQVDDAVTSRCIARIDYQPPGAEDQKAIWRVLDQLNGTGLAGEDIEAIVERHDDLTGRDIKQLLKLAAIWSSSHHRPVTPAAIDYVRQFLPTRPHRGATKPEPGNLPEMDMIPGLLREMERAERKSGGKAAGDIFRYRQSTSGAR